MLVAHYVVTCSNLDTERFRNPLALMLRRKVDTLSERLKTFTVNNSEPEDLVVWKCDSISDAENWRSEIENVWWKTTR